MHSDSVKVLLLHPWNVWNSHGSDIVLVVMFLGVRSVSEGVCVTPAPDSVIGFQNGDVGGS